MEGGFLLDVVVRECSSVFQLFASEDQPLLVWGNAFLILDLCLHVLDGIRRFNFQGDCLSSQGLHKDLHTSSQSEDKMEGGLLLDVVVGEGSSIFQLFSSKDQPLLVWRNSFLVLDLGFYIFDGIRRLNFQGNGLASQGLHKDLHTSSQPQDKMKGRLFLDVVVRQSPPILKLLSGKDQPLLVWGNTFLILDLGLHVFNSIRRFHF